MASTQEHTPPSAAALAIGSAIVSGIMGYYLGQARSIGLFGSSPVLSPTSHTDAHSDHAETDLSESEDEAQDLGALNSFRANTEECKLVLVVRTDLGMTKGKIAAQCGHATLACYKTLLRADPAHAVLKQWERLGQAKVAVKVDNEEDMLMLQAQAISLGICAQVIHDAGRTQIASGSATVLGIGPAPKSQVDQVTGHLRLL